MQRGPCTLPLLSSSHCPPPATCLLPQTSTLSSPLDGGRGVLSSPAQHLQGQHPRDNGVMGCYSLLKGLLPWERLDHGRV